MTTVSSCGVNLQHVFSGWERKTKIGIHVNFLISFTLTISQVQETVVLELLYFPVTQYCVYLMDSQQLTARFAMATTQATVT